MKKRVFIPLIIFIISVASGIGFAIPFFIGNTDRSTENVLAVALLSLVILLAFSFYFVYLFRNKRERKLSTKIFNVSLEEILSFGKIGILILDDGDKIIWANNYLSSLFTTSLIDIDFRKILSQKNIDLNARRSIKNLSIGSHNFNVDFFPNTNLVFLRNNTVFQSYIEKVYNENIAIGMVSIDNLDKTLNSIAPDLVFITKTKAYEILNQWFKDNDILSIELKQGLFFVVTTRVTLARNSDMDFPVLGIFEKFSREIEHPLFLSMGFGYGYGNLNAIHHLASQNLTLSQQRGGNQVVLTEYESDIQTFRGGITESPSSNSRIDVRAFSTRLIKRMKSAEKVVLVGHKFPDFDCLASQLGLYFCLKNLNKNVKIVLNFKEIDKNTIDSLKKIVPPSVFKEAYVNDVASEKFSNDKTLMIVVDTNFPERIQNPALNDIVKDTIVIDHHRSTGATFKNVVDSYVNSGASSTAEILTEILTYSNLVSKLPKFVFDLLLTGIIVDTNSFKVRTTSRTFDACAKLQELGASTKVADNFLKSYYDDFVLKNKLIEGFKIYKDKIAIAVADPNIKAPKSIIAQAAEELIKLKGVELSFVICYDSLDVSSMSCRSAGKINVQTIAQKLGGGGHFTAAAVEKPDFTTENMLDDLLLIVDDIELPNK